MTRKAYEGEQITVSFDATRCLHAAECVRGLPAVFDTKRRPWIDPDGAGAQDVAEVVRRCPSGALQYDLPDGPPEPARRETTITAQPGEPLWVRGEVLLETADGNRRETRAALCRCGSSANAPYCDASGDCTAWH
jgi:uncharacterized Fe-S cluster protein YjdI/CDGSH-type Zn-finger protein